MLGRYVAGTLLILGAAMMVAPESPKPRSVEVSRAETSPASLAAAEPAAMAAAADRATTRLTEPAVASEAPASSELKQSVEAALVEALALDATEDRAATNAEVSVSLASLSGNDAAAATEEAPVADNLVLNGKFEFPIAPEASDGATAPQIESAALGEPAARRLFVTGTRVNVRAGPSTQHRVVGTVDYGEEVELVTYEGQGWARIRMGDETGYMSRRFLASDLTGG